VISYQDFEFQSNRKDNQTLQPNLILEFKGKLNSRSCIDKGKRQPDAITFCLDKGRKVAKHLKEIERMLEEKKVKEKNITFSNLFQEPYCCKHSVGLRKETAWNVVDQEETSEILASKQNKTGFKTATGKANGTWKWRNPLSGEYSIGGNVK
jgi:hypothetical protein